jgi:phosphatidylglycerol:prolipoprotein diacylglycerol transferase
MPLLAIPFPAFDPVIFSVGGVSVHWYALAYIAGILCAWWLARRIAENRALWGGHSPIRASDVDDVIAWCALGIVLGGRLGYVIFYGKSYFFTHPSEILQLWHGGMSFHGGFLGTIAALLLYAYRHKIPLLSMLDLGAVVTPIGLFLGRIANFVNGELWGRVTDVPWAFVFPHAGPLPRHPSQLYEAGLEGIVLFAVGLIAVRMGALERPGLVGGLFVAGYGLARVAGEQFRQPDAQLGFLAGGLTMGTLLSLPMIAAGAVAIVCAMRKAPARKA